MSHQGPQTTTGQRRHRRRDSASLVVRIHNVLQPLPLQPTFPEISLWSKHSYSHIPSMYGGHTAARLATQARSANVGQSSVQHRSSQLCLVNTDDTDKTKQSSLVGSGVVNWIGDKLRLSGTENFETEHVQCRIKVCAIDAAALGPFVNRPTKRTGIFSLFSWLRTAVPSQGKTH